MLTYFKNIFYGKHNILTQICLFSIIGIMTTLFSNLITLYSPTNYFGYCSMEMKQLMPAIILSIIIFSYLAGYIYTYTNSLFEEPKTQLPEISFKPLLNFLKMLPVHVIWAVYFAGLIFLGLVMFKMFTPVSYTYYTLIACLAPFTFLIITIYSKNFGFGYSIYNPFKLFTIIRKTFLKTANLTIRLALIVICSIFAFKFCFYQTRLLANFPTLQLAVRLILLTLCVYFTNVYALVFAQGAVNISNKL